MGRFRPDGNNRRDYSHRERGDHRFANRMVTPGSGDCRTNPLWAKGRTPAGNKHLDRPISPTWVCDGRKRGRR